jgi:hypothetical protein
MINYGANYIGVDRDRYDAGNKFYSQDRFLQGVGLDKPAITFNSSPDNSGIMGMYPRYPYPPILSEDGGDGGGPFGGIDKGEITSDVGFGNLDDQTNMGYTLTEEDKAEIAAQKNKNRLAMAGKLGFFALNPMGYITGKGITEAGKGVKRGFNFLKDKFFGGEGDGVPDNVTKAGGTYTGGYHSAEGGFENTSSNPSSNPSGGVDAGTADVQDYADIYAVGGRVGYSNGGLSKYEIFKLGELGYNTKGGTVLAPFGGIKVLRDILKVNQYAGGGIVGLYR